MLRYKNVLAAVDLSEGDHIVGNQLPSTTAHAVHDAIGLALASGAQLTFFHALDVSDRTRQMIEGNFGTTKDVRDQAGEMLEKLVSQAKVQGVEARSQFEFGRAWIEIIRQVESGGYDLVIAGTRREPRSRPAIFGNTGLMLVRHCPCPVWITRPNDSKKIANIVAATDLSDVSNLVVDLGASVAGMTNAQLHIVHAYGETTKELRTLGLLDHHEHGIRQVAEAARKEIAQQLEREDVKSLGDSVHHYLIDGQPHDVIVQQIEEHNADLLVMATLGKWQFKHILMGSTATRLMSVVNCSVVTVKPEGFEPSLAGIGAMLDS